MLNPPSLHILNIIFKRILITFLDDPELFLHKNGFKYCNVTVTINISHLFSHILIDIHMMCNWVVCN